MNKIVKANPQSLPPPRTIRFVISDETSDRVGDIIKTSAWDFTEFEKNPQFLGFHNYADFPLGIPVKWFADQKAKKTYMDVYFPTVEELATNPDQASETALKVDTVYNMYKIGMLNAVSVGFRALESEPRNDQAELPNWQRGNLILKAELLEVSAVPVPANPNATAIAKSFDPKMREHAEKILKEGQAMIEEKSGAVLSHGTKAKLETIMSHHEAMGEHMKNMTKCYKAMKEAYESLIGPPDDAGPDEPQEGPQPKKPNESGDQGLEKTIDIEQIRLSGDAKRKE